MGVSTTAVPEQARRIPKQVQDASRPVGTVISIENNVGVIRRPNQR